MEDATDNNTWERDAREMRALRDWFDLSPCGVFASLADAAESAGEPAAYVPWPVRTSAFVLLWFFACVPASAPLAAQLTETLLQEDARRQGFDVVGDAPPHPATEDADMQFSPSPMASLPCGGMGGAPPPMFRAMREEVLGVSAERARRLVDLLHERDAMSASEVLNKVHVREFLWRLSELLAREGAAGVQRAFGAACGAHGLFGFASSAPALLLWNWDGGGVSSTLALGPGPMSETHAHRQRSAGAIGAWTQLQLFHPHDVVSTAGEMVNWRIPRAPRPDVVGFVHCMAAAYSGIIELRVVLVGSHLHSQRPAPPAVKVVLNAGGRGNEICAMLTNELRALGECLLQTQQQQQHSRKSGLRVPLDVLECVPVLPGLTADAYVDSLQQRPDEMMQVRAWWDPVEVQRALTYPATPVAPSPSASSAAQPRFAPTPLPLWNDV